MNPEEQQQRTRSLPGLPPEETESRMQTGQSDDISEAVTVSEKHLDDQSDPVNPQNVTPPATTPTLPPKTAPATPSS